MRTHDAGSWPHIAWKAAERNAVGPQPHSFMRACHSSESALVPLPCAQLKDIQSQPVRPLENVQAGITKLDETREYLELSNKTFNDEEQKSDFQRVRYTPDTHIQLLGCYRVLHLLRKSGIVI